MHYSDHRILPKRRNLSGLLTFFLPLMLLVNSASAQNVFVQPDSRDILAARLQLAASGNSERKKILTQQFAHKSSSSP
jgi:hypothetical protein